MKRVMCVYLPGWPLQRLRRRGPGRRAEAVAVIDPQGPRGPKVVLASRRAVRGGVRPGMPLAEALALVPDLAAHEQDPDADRAALGQLAKQAECYSPIVGVEDGAAPSSLLLDVTGCAACFGGEDRLLEKAARELAGDGWVARLALADTVGAAWALAHFAASPLLAPPGQTEAVLAPLPVAALRLPPDTLALFHRLGVVKVRDLLALPRPDVAVRFGPDVGRRLDQALGRVPEVILPPPAPPELRAGWTFEFPTDRLDVVAQVVERLAEEVHQALRRRNLGARRLECRLYHEHRPAVRVEVGLYRPTGCPRHLAGLLRTQLERVTLDEPVCAVGLAVPLAETVPEAQGEFFDTGRADEAELGALIDRLSGSLGREAVTRVRCVADPQPEHAYRSDPVLAPADAEEDEHPPTLPRPLSLWPVPVAVDVVASVPDGPPRRFRWGETDYRVEKWWGPERVETGWWRGDDVRRDYYVVTTQAGSRFWVFRRGEGGWFLHGCFD